MFIWEPEGRYCHRLCTALAPILVLKRTSLNSVNVLLALNWRYVGVTTGHWKLKSELSSRLSSISSQCFQLVRASGLRCWVSVTSIMRSASRSSRSAWRRSTGMAGWWILRNCSRKSEPREGRPSRHKTSVCKLALHQLSFDWVYIHVLMILYQIMG